MHPKQQSGFGVQIGTVDLDDPRDCMAKFVSNRNLGALVYTGILADKLGGGTLAFL